MILLDWEGWGSGPINLDVCFLYAFSLNNPSVCEEIAKAFYEEFHHNEFDLTLLFVFAELKRMNRLHGSYGDLIPFIKKMENKLMQKMNIKC